MHAPIFLLRLALDFTAVGLLIAGLAYWWLGNTAHELIGTAMFVLVAVHNGFNRRWYGRIGRDRRQRRGLLTICLNFTLIAAMTALLVTSLIVSRSVFGFLPFDGGITAREMHILAAYWAVVLVGSHVGLNWRIVMNFARTGFGISGGSTVRTVLLRTVAAGIAFVGALASFEMMLGSKLVMQPVLDMWDFNEGAPLFFANYAAIIGLWAGIGHYGAMLMNVKAKAPRTSDTCRELSDNA
jgi:hypothetical protein